jgi:cell division septation protein DedD
MPDQNVREIQLNGKQLVFMFMTATVAAVVIFLCGVMVGRGVSTTRAAEIAAVMVDTAVDPTVIAPAPDSTEAEASSTVRASSEEDLKDLSYARRLEAPEAPPEPTVEPVAAPVPAIAEAKPSPLAVVAAARPAEATAGPRGDGFVVQVASLRSRAEADAVARRLSSKGFPSFVTTPGSGGPRVFRVRVGKYVERREAESVARRLEKEEQFKPWITR